MTLKEIEQNCLKEALKAIGRFHEFEAEGESEKQAVCFGQVNAFLLVASWIQNNKGIAKGTA